MSCRGAFNMWVYIVKQCTVLVIFCTVLSFFTSNFLCSLLCWFFVTFFCFPTLPQITPWQRLTCLHTGFRQLGSNRFWGAPSGYLAVAQVATTSPMRRAMANWKLFSRAFDAHAMVLRRHCFPRSNNVQCSRSARSFEKRRVNEAYAFCSPPLPLYECWSERRAFPCFIFIF